MIVEPALVVTLFIVIIDQVRLEQLVHESGHAAQRLLGDHRGPDAQRKLLGGLFIDDVLGRPWSQVPRRCFAGSAARSGTLFLLAFAVACFKALRDIEG